MRKKIVIISNVSRSLVNFRGDLIKEWLENGYEVTALAPDSEKEKEIKNLGADFVKYKLNRSGLNPFQDLISLFNLFKILKSLDPDYCFSYTIKPVIYGSLASKLSGVNEIYSMLPGLGYVFSKEGNYKLKIIRAFIEKCYKFVFNFNRKVFFQNKDDKNLFKSKGIIKEKKSAVTRGSGVDIKEYPFSPIRKDESDYINFLMMARLIKQKGILEFLKAAEKIKKKFPKTKFNILGPKADNPNSIDERKLDYYTENEIVNYHGKVNNVKPYIKKSSVFVLPSYYREGTPRSILEAMSMGRAIITTKNPGCRETVKDGYNGFLIPPKDSGQLAEKMRYFINKPNEVQRMGRNSRKFAEKYYDVDKVNQFILEEMNIR